MPFSRCGGGQAVRLPPSSPRTPRAGRCPGPAAGRPPHPAPARPQGAHPSHALREPDHEHAEHDGGWGLGLAENEAKVSKTI